MEGRWNSSVACPLRGYIDREREWKRSGSNGEELSSGNVAATNMTGYGAIKDLSSRARSTIS